MIILMRAFSCRGDQSFDPICPKTLYCLSPTQMLLNRKFDPDSEIFKFESMGDGFVAVLAFALFVNDMLNSIYMYV